MTPADIQKSLENLSASDSSNTCKGRAQKLFLQGLYWGKPSHESNLPLSIAGMSLEVQPIAEAGGIGVWLVPWPEGRLPSLTKRREVHRKLAQHQREHLLCFVTQAFDEVAFVWAHPRMDRKTELRTLPYKAGTPARTTIERLGKLAFSLDELGATGHPSVSHVIGKLQTAFSVEAVTKQFYQEIANWYFWAREQVVFPMPPTEKNREAYISQSLIRLITRLIFCWFLKEMGLIPAELFDLRTLSKLLKNGSQLPKSCETTFYKAILQNLFFATLNQEISKRQFRKRNKDPHGRDPHRGITNLYRYEDYFTDPKEFLRLVERIPFLNGGLFECLDQVYRAEENRPDIRIDGFSDHPKNPLSVPDYLFFGEERTVDLSAAYGEAKYKRATVRGLIHIFNHYNFTVTESTPLDQEVALDPEMAGKIFENLLAAYNPETATTARKATGSYYTPREIVDYMVDESLIAYLKIKLDESHPSDTHEARLRHLLAYTDDPHQFNSDEVQTLILAIDHLKALDPACGSGAFPMGLLHKLVFLLSKLDPRNEQWKQRQIQRVQNAMQAAAQIEDAAIRERTLKDLEQQIASIEDAFSRGELDYGRKLYLIENCIYGVDIQPIAVQIAKMRFFISLTIEQKVDPTQPNLGIRPLPNLETQFVAANSLIGIQRSGQAVLRNPQIDAKEAELRQVRERYFTARTPETKAKYRQLDAQIRAEISELLQKDGFPRETTEKLTRWDPYDQNASADFFDPEWMFGIRGGFDVIIGNPPYINTKRGVQDKDTLKRIFTTATGQFDVFTLFIEFAIKESRNIVSFIVPKPFINNENYESIRKMALMHSIPKVVIGSGIFEAAGVESCIFILSKQSTTPQIEILKFEDSEFYISNQLDKEACSILPFHMLNTELGQDDIKLYRALRTRSIPLGNLVEITRGVECGKNDSAITRTPNQFPLLRGEDVTRYKLIHTGLFIRFDPRNEIKFKPIAIYRSRKILIRRVSDELIATFDSDGYIVLNTLYCCIPRGQNCDILFLTGLINSALLSFWFKKTFVLTDKLFPYIRKSQLELLPICSAAIDDPHRQTTIIKLVERILATKKRDATADTSALEREIDEHVYRLYGLTPEEIRIVEESTS